MAITYRDLLTQLKMLPEARLDDTVTVYVSGLDEFYPLVDDYPFCRAEPEETDVLDNGHPYMVI